MTEQLTHTHTHTHTESELKKMFFVWNHDNHVIIFSSFVH